MTPFVGRTHELGRLLSRLAAAEQGAGGIVLLAGEPGIGKTRLAEELAATARGRGAAVYWGRCYEGEGAPAFWPWVQVIGSYVRESGIDTFRSAVGTGIADIARLLPDLNPHIPPPPTADLEPAQARFRLFTSVTALLLAAARGRATDKSALTPQPPLLLILDDLHWADAPSLLLLQFLARELRDTPLLLLGTYRDSEVGRGHPLGQTLGQLMREPHVERIMLGGLSEPDVACYLDQVEGAPTGVNLAAAVYRETEGHPLFVTEVVRLLAGQEGYTHRSASSAHEPDVRIPQSVREVIQLRLDRLSPATNRVLAIAAVIGREFSIGALRLVAELDGGPLLEWLAEAEEARVIAPTDATPGQFVFSHALIQGALYDGLPSARRVDLHRQAGEALERLWRTDLETHAAELAHHFYQAAPGGDVNRAVSYCRRAGDRALALLAYEEAARHYLRALDALGMGVPVPSAGSAIGDGHAASDEALCAMLLALGDAHNRAGQREQARDAFERAAAVARTMMREGAPEGAAGLVRAALGFAGPLVTIGSADPATVALLNEAITATDGDESAGRVQLLARLAVELYWSGDEQRRTALSDESVALARRLGDAATLAYTLHARHCALWSPDNLDERLAMADEIVHLAERAGDRDLALQGRHWRLAGALEQGDITTVDAQLAAHDRLARELRQPFHLWYAARGEAMRATLDGRFAEAERLIGQARTLSERAGRQDAALVHSAQLFTLRRLQGRLDEMEETFRAGSRAGWTRWRRPFAPSPRASRHCRSFTAGWR